MATTMLTEMSVYADETVNSYGHYLTITPNCEEFQSRIEKTSATTDFNSQIPMLKSVLKNKTLIANDYIEFNTTNDGLYSIGTTGGNPSSSFDDNKKILFGHPNGSTSKTTINVNGNINQFRSSSVTYDANSARSVSKASYDGIDIIQEISIIENYATGRDDLVQIKYSVNNTTGSTKQVGLRIMMDTMLGSNDASPFRVKGKNVTTEIEYRGDDIPQIWQAFDSIANPGVVAQGTFYKSGDLKPDKVQFTNWRNVTNVLWNYVTQTGRPNGDSAVAITWNLDALASGETREYVTYYGLSELKKNLVPPIALSSYADNTLEYRRGEYGNANLSIYLENISDVDVNNVVLSVSAPNYLEYIGSSLFPKKYSTMVSGSQETVSLSYRLKPNFTVTKDLVDEIKITLSYPLGTEGVEVKEITQKIKIPKVNKAIVIVPGMMGSRLFKKSGERCWEPFWIDNDGNGNYYVDWEDADSLTNILVNAGVLKRLVTDITHLSCDRYGTSCDPIDLGRQTYGTLDVYKDLYDALNAERFNENTDVIFYAYDWRLDINSQLSSLHEKIKNYDDVNFVAHSMGGLLVDSYVNNYSAQNVSKVVTLGTPFGGSPLVGKVLLSGDTSDVFVDSGVGFAGTLIQMLTNNFTSMYELLPNEEYVYNKSWLNRRSVRYTGSWWEFWKTENYDEPLNFDSTNKIIGDICNDKLLDKALDFQGSNDNKAYDRIETIAFIGNSHPNTFASLSFVYTNEGFYTIPSYSNGTISGDSIVPIISAKQRFENYKIYNQSHMGIIEDKKVILDVISFIKNDEISITRSYSAISETPKLLAEYAPTFNYQLAFKGNMNMSAISNDEKITLNFLKVDDSWLGIYDIRDYFRIDRMGNIDNQEMYICTYLDNKFSYTFESLEDQSIDFVISDGTNSFVVSDIEVYEGSIITVNTQNKTINVNEITYEFKNINSPIINDKDISLKSRNIFSNTISDTIASRIKLTNLSDQDININDLEIIYLYDNDGNVGEIFECDWAGLDNESINNSVNGDISYDEEYGYSKVTLSFNKTENSFIPRNADLDIHFRVHTSNWDKYDLSNDYSLNGDELTANDRILVYYKKTLVSGNVE